MIVNETKIKVQIDLSKFRRFVIFFVLFEFFSNPFEVRGIFKKREQCSIYFNCKIKIQIYTWMPIDIEI